MAGTKPMAATYGLWSVEGVDPAPRTGGALRYLCRCACGVSQSVCGDHLRRGGSRGCRACRGHARTTHGHAAGRTLTRELKSYRAMLIRCSNPKSVHYARYGGRGICVCAPWLDRQSGFAQFLSDVGLSPSSDHSIDRINNDGNYEPGNVRWATDVEQARNKSDTCWVEYDGRRQSLAAWAEERELPPKLLWERMFSAGWDVARAMTEPLRTPAMVMFRGKLESIHSLSVRACLSPSTVRRRVRAGWSIERALAEPPAPVGHGSPRWRAQLAVNGTEAAE